METMEIHVSFFPLGPVGDNATYHKVKPYLCNTHFLVGDFKTVSSCRRENFPCPTVHSEGPYEGVSASKSCAAGCGRDRSYASYASFEKQKM